MLRASAGGSSPPAGLCLARLATTFTLSTESNTDDSGSPAEEPTPTGSYAVDCQEIADCIEEARSEAGRRQPDAVGSAPTAS